MISRATRQDAEAIARYDEVYIRSMAVHPDARSKGVGAQLLTVVHAYAVSCDARRLSLSTTPFLGAAIRLYERAGFERMPKPNDLFGTPIIVMTKPLPLTTTASQASGELRESDG